MGVVNSQCIARLQFPDENERVRRRDAIGVEDGIFIETEIGRSIKVDIWGGIGAFGKNVENGPFGENGKGGIRRGVGSYPIKCSIKNPGLAWIRSAIGVIVDSEIGSIEVAQHEIISMESKGHKCEEDC